MKLATAVGCAVNGGIFFAFSSFVMPALNKLGPEKATSAMNAINVAAVRPTFMTVLFGTAALTVATGVAGVRQRDGLLIAGSAVYLGGSLVLGYDVELARTLLLSTLILSGVGNAVVATHGDRRLVAWGLFAVAALAAVMAVDPFAYFFALTPPSFTQWACILFAAACVVGSTAAFSESERRANGNRRSTAGGPMHVSRAASEPPRSPE